MDEFISCGRGVNSLQLYIVAVECLPSFALERVFLHILFRFLVQSLLHEGEGLVEVLLLALEGGVFPEIAHR